MFLKIVSSRQKSQISRRLNGKLRVLGLPALAIALWFGYKQLESYLSQPKAIFVLGGHEERERFAAKLAAQHPNLPIWVSSGSPKSYSQRIFKKAGIQRDRLHLDYRAIDTVTNFTTLADELKAQGIDSVYLVTSENHMGRARLIGAIVFGSRGIVIKPVSVPCHAPPEPLEKSLRDGARAILWLVTGYTGESLIRF
jgi:uncharacterized SAM-binding protein YcdF (DUF218 family)